MNNLLKGIGFGKFMSQASQADDRTPCAGLHRVEKFCKKCGSYFLAASGTAIATAVISKALVELFTTPPQRVNNKSVSPYRREVPKR